MFNVFWTSIAFLLITIFYFAFTHLSIVHGNEIDSLILDSTTKKVSLYPTLYMLGDNEKKLTIDDVTSHEFS